MARTLGVGGLGLLCALPVQASSNVFLTDVPDYEWFVGCFGTATGNIAGYWDRHGFPNLYTGPTSYGLAPLDSVGANFGIRSLWATQAGIDGRPIDRLGHVENYYVAYASDASDPHVTYDRPEHEPDCLGDFIGLSQRKWTNLNGECDGNIDAYSFVYWDSSGDRRINFTPGTEAGLPARDIQSGLRAWTKHRGYNAEVFTQLGDINPEVPPGKGFTFQDLKAEIDAGYPVLMFLQDVRTKSRAIGITDRANPLIHGILGYGYTIADDGTEYVRYRSSFASGDNQFGAWRTTTSWHTIAPLRGVIGYHPSPRITGIIHVKDHLTFEWQGPDASLYNANTGESTRVHRYVIERATSLTDLDFTPIIDPTTDNKITISAPEDAPAFFRLRLVPPAAADTETKALD